MSTNKHAIIRYQALDRCFSNWGRKYFIEDLIEACNQAIYDYTGNTDGIKRRQLFEDINFMESEAGYAIPLERKSEGRKKYYRYSDKHFSINKQPISQTEAEQLKDTIMMLSRFKGLPQFDWIEEILARFEDTFKLKANADNVVSFEQNPHLKGIEHFTNIFNAIINKQVLKINYRASFGAPQHYEIHPHFLKQYNNRWFLFGICQSDEESKLMNMAIDRIVDFESQSQVAYIENKDIDFSKYFHDVIGVTVPNNKPTEKILLKIDLERYNYIESKPIHPTQTVKEKNGEYAIIELKLIPNYEFETLLLGFADSTIILEPQSLRETISLRAKKILEKNSTCADASHSNTLPLQ